MKEPQKKLSKAQEAQAISLAAKKLIERELLKRKNAAPAYSEKRMGYAVPKEQNLQTRLEAVGVGKGCKIIKITLP